MNTSKKRKITKEEVRENKKIKKQERKQKKIKKDDKQSSKNVKENDMRWNRRYSDYYLTEVMPKKEMYKLKDFILDWWLDSKPCDDAFWCFVGENPHAVFMFHNKKNLRLISTTHYRETEIEKNSNLGILMESLIEIIEEGRYTKSRLDWVYMYRENTNSYVLYLMEKKLNNIIDRVINTPGYDWRDDDELNYTMEGLSENPKAVHIIKEKMHYLKEGCWWRLASNPNAVSLFESLKEIDIDTLRCLCENPNAIHIIEKHKEKLDSDCWENLSANPNAIKFMEDNIDKLDLCSACSNPNAIHIIEKNKEKLYDVCWEYLSENPNAIPLLEQNIENVDWDSLAYNENGIELFMNHFEKFIKQFEKAIKGENIETLENVNPIYHNICFTSSLLHLTSNKKSIKLFEKYPILLNEYILKNPMIFEVNYEYLKNKLNYVDYEEEERICSYLKENNINITKEEELSIKNRVNTDYITLREIDIVIRKYNEKDEYLPESRLIFEISIERLIKAVLHPKRVNYYLTNYNYDILSDEYVNDSSDDEM